MKKLQSTPIMLALFFALLIGAWPALAAPPVIDGVTPVVPVDSSGNYPTTVNVGAITGTSDMNLKQWGGTAVTAGAALADAAANPTTGQIGAYAQGFNGTTWDRLRTAPSNPTTPAQFTGILQTNPAFWRTTGDYRGAVDVGSFQGGSTSTNGVQAVGPLAIYQSTLPTLTNTMNTPLEAGTRGSLNTTLFQQDSSTALTTANYGDGANNMLPAGGYGFNGATWDRLRVAKNASDADSGTGLLSAQGWGFNGTNFDRLRTSTVGTGQLIAAPPDYSYVHIAAGQATTVIKGSPGFLHNVCFNSAATATNTTTIYDNASTSGNVIAIPNAVAATVPNCITYDLKAALGIVIITAAANGSDMTVSYR